MARLRSYRIVRDELADDARQVRAFRQHRPMTHHVVCKIHKALARIEDARAELRAMMHPDAANFIVAEITGDATVPSARQVAFWRNGA
jgi:hypothetical protein